MKKLYIIGNGFDLHHDMKTKYQDFADFLKTDNRNTFQNIERYLSDSQEFWWNFEDNLTMFDDEYVIDDNSHLMGSYGADDWSDSMHHDFQFELNEIIKSLTESMLESFCTWLRQVKYPENCDSFHKRSNLNKNELYLSFNYTNTLEKIYDIPKDSILYIHGNIKEGKDKIFLGHGWSSEERPTLISRADFERDDIRLTDGYKIVDSYFSSTFKPVAKIIEINSNYFSKLNSIDEILVLGHSLSEVDMPYFKEISKNIDLSKVKWWVSCYCESDFEKAEKLRDEIQIPEMLFKTAAIEPLINLKP